MKKGYTLIETLIATSIILIIYTITYFSVSNYRNIKNDIELVACENTVLSIINNGKQYCRENEKSGFVLLDMSKSEIGFYSQGKRIDFFKFPGEISINSISTNRNRIDIDKSGFTSDAATIVLKDNKNNFYNITINVGVGYAEIKE